MARTPHSNGKEGLSQGKNSCLWKKYRWQSSSGGCLSQVRENRTTIILNLTILLSGNAGANKMALELLLIEESTPAWEDSSNKPIQNYSKYRCKMCD